MSCSSAPIPPRPGSFAVPDRTLTRLALKKSGTKMKLCAVSDGLGNLPLNEAARAASDLGLAALEIGSGNWSPAPHANIQSLLESKEKREDFLSVLEQKGLSLAALDCSVNQLHSVDGERQSKVVYDTVRAAELLGVNTIVLMSGLPGGGPKDETPNWITCAWPQEVRKLLDWQWNEKLLPRWEKLASFAKRSGITKPCIERHGHQLVYNVPTLLRLRKEIGPIVGANFDPRFRLTSPATMYCQCCPNIGQLCRSVAELCPGVCYCTVGWNVDRGSLQTFGLADRSRIQSHAGISSTSPSALLVASSANAKRLEKFLRHFRNLALPIKGTSTF
jgi:sugar phosphate isomerase/epimerase